MKIKYIAFFVGLILAGCSDDTSTSYPAVATATLPTATEGCEFKNNALLCLGDITSLGEIDKIANLNSIQFSNASMSQALMSDFPVLMNVKKFVYQGNPSGNLQFNAFSISKFPNSETVEISGNPELNSFEFSEKLKSLNLSNNGLSFVDLSLVPQLQSLDLSKNRLTSINLRPLENLHSLNLSNNPLDAFDLSALTELKSLALNNSGVIQIDLSTFTQLQSLDLGSNQLTAMDVNALTQLQSLDLGSNQLTAMDVNALTQLQSLNVSSNQLTAMDVNALTQLQSLNVSNNQLTAIELSNLSAQLQSLNLSNNPLGAFDLSALTELKSLALNNMGMTQIDLRTLTQLQSLDLASNQFRGIDVSALTPSLKTLMIYNNNELRKDGLILNPEMSFSLSLFGTLIQETDIPELQTKYPNVEFNFDEIIGAKR